MRIAYLDESGVPDVGQGTSHFVLCALTIGGETWRAKDAEVSRIKKRFGLGEHEIHAAWLARRMPEQEGIAGFEGLDSTARRSAVEAARKKYLVSVAATKGQQKAEAVRRDYRKSAGYVQLTHAERIELLRQVADVVGGWDDVWIFADCINKTALRRGAPSPPLEEAFTQVVSRFQKFLERQTEYGLLVHDNNETSAGRLTSLMRRFHASGTRWTESISRLVETPLFVDSHLTSMVQVSDVCAYALRRFCENGETDLFNRIKLRFGNDPTTMRTVGVRHYAGPGRACSCVICRAH